MRALHLILEATLKLKLQVVPLITWWSHWSRGNYLTFYRCERFSSELTINFCKSGSKELNISTQWRSWIPVKLLKQKRLIHQMWHQIKLKTDYRELKSWKRHYETIVELFEKLRNSAITARGVQVEIYNKNATTSQHLFCFILMYQT